MIPLAKRRARLGGATRAIAAQAGLALATLWALATGVFFVLRLVPGDPAALVLGDLADAGARAALRAQLHLDEPLVVQYGRFLRGVAALDLGPSLRTPARSAFGCAFHATPPTAVLATLAVSLGTLGGVIGAVLGIGPWLGRGRSAVPTLVVLVAATPLLAFAPVVTYLFAIRTRVLPLPGDPQAGAGGAVFAACLLAVPLGAQVARVARAALRDLEREPFLDVVRAKGAGPIRTWFIHALPAASGPIMTVVATQLGALLGGAVVLERLFDRPGLGTLMLESYAARDLPVLEASILVSGAFFVIAQFLASLAHALVDPRVMREGG